MSVLTEILPYADGPYSRLKRVAAEAIAMSFCFAISQLFIGRLAKVPKPQSGFKKMRSAGR